MALASVYFDVHPRCNLSNQAKITCASLYECGYVQNIPPVINKALLTQASSKSSN